MKMEWTEARTGLGEFHRTEFMMAILKASELPKKVGLLYNECVKKYSYKMTYRTFQREIDKLRERELIKTTTKIGGDGGSFTVVEKIE